MSVSMYVLEEGSVLEEGGGRREGYLSTLGRRTCLMEEGIYEGGKCVWERRWKYPIKSMSKRGNPSV